MLRANTTISRAQVVSFDSFITLFTAVSCPHLERPDNGDVSYTSRTVCQSVASFSCDSGYQISGPSLLTCRADGTWSGRPPTCRRMLAIITNNV